MLGAVIYDEFVNDTANEFTIFGCRYMNTGCLQNWTMEFTRFGRCAVFNPDVNQIGEKTAVGRKASLSIVVGYNQSDANVGWYSFLSGVTMYYSSPSESFLDPLNSLSLPPETVPMLSVVQVLTLCMMNSFLKFCDRSIVSYSGHRTQHAFKITQTSCLTFQFIRKTAVCMRSVSNFKAFLTSKSVSPMSLLVFAIAFHSICCRRDRSKNVLS